MTKKKADKASLDDGGITPPSVIYRIKKFFSSKPLVVTVFVVIVVLMALVAAISAIMGKV